MSHALQVADAVPHLLEVLIETPRGSRNKYALDPRSGLLKLRKVLPVGMSFPFDFGCVPGTRAEDGDPLDVIVLMEDPVVAGCLVDVFLLGVMKAKQGSRGEKKQRNDRLIAAAAEASRPLEFKSMKRVTVETLDEIERFFVTYNELLDQSFELIEIAGPRAAWKVVEAARRNGRQPAVSALHVPRRTVGAH